VIIPGGTDDRLKREDETGKIMRLLRYLEFDDLQAVEAFVLALMEKGTTDGEMHEAQMVGAERRVYKRLGARLPITYKTLDQAGFLKRVSSLDISGGGMRFVLMSRDRVNIGDFIELQMLLPDNMGIIIVQAQAKRVSLAPGGKGYEVGVEFLHITDKQRERIDKYVGKLACNNDPANEI
jgi:hypothetical protein